MDIPIKDQLYSDIQNNCRLKSGEDIPTFEQVLERFSAEDILLFVEFKDKPLPHTMQMMAEYYSLNPERLRPIAFKHEYLKLLQKQAKSNPWWKKVRMLDLQYFLPLPLSRFGIDVHFLAGPLTFIQKWRKKERAVWTVDKETDMRKAFAHGIDYVTTNDPKLCLLLKASMPNE